MNKSIKNGTIVLGNSNDYASILVGLNEIKKSQKKVNEVNLELHGKYEELIANINQIITSWQDNGKNTDKLSTLLGKVQDTDNRLYDETDSGDLEDDAVYQRIESALRKIESAINAFSANFNGEGGSSSAEYENTLNGFIRELRAIIKEDAQNSGE